MLVALSILLLFGAILALQLLVSFTERSHKASALAAYAAARGMTPFGCARAQTRPDYPAEGLPSRQAQVRATRLPPDGE